MVNQKQKRRKKQQANKQKSQSKKFFSKLISSQFSMTIPLENITKPKPLVFWYEGFEVHHRPKIGMLTITEFGYILIWFGYFLLPNYLFEAKYHIYVVIFFLLIFF